MHPKAFDQNTFEDPPQAPPTCQANKLGAADLSEQIDDGAHRLPAMLVLWFSSSHPPWHLPDCFKNLGIPACVACTITAYILTQPASTFFSPVEEIMGDGEY